MFASMLTQPGSGYLGSGLQQVVDRPFGLSEWIHVYPNVYAAEGPAIVAAYGMGLQGWDASYEFQSQADRRVFDDTAGRLPLGRLGGGRAHVAGPVPRPGPDDLPRRRQGGRGHLGAPRQPGRPGRGPVLLLRQGRAARRRENLRRQRAPGSPGRRARRRRVHRQVPAVAAAGHEPLPPGFGHQVGDGAAGLGHFRPGVFHGQHRGHEGGRRLRRRQGADAGRREGPARLPVRVAVPDRAGARRGPRQLQAGAAHRAGPAEQHRLHLLRARQQGPEERRAADPAGAGEGDVGHRGPAALQA